MFGATSEPVKADINDVTASRVDDVIYQNTLSRPMMVIISFKSTHPALGDNAYFRCLIGATSPPTIATSRAGLGPAGATGDDFFFTMMFVVPPNYYYLADDILFGTGAVTILSWIEVEL